MDHAHSICTGYHSSSETISNYFSEGRGSSRHLANEFTTAPDLNAINLPKATQQESSNAGMQK